VEGAVFEVAQEVIRTGMPKLVNFGISDEFALDVGLACGGTIEVFIESWECGGASGSRAGNVAMSTIFESLRRCVEERRLVALATVVGGPGERLGAKLLIHPDGSTQGDLGSAKLNAGVVQRAIELLNKQSPGRMTVEASHDVVDVFVDVVAPSPKLIIVGAVHIAIPLVTFAKALGFRTIVVDARSVFASPERFAHADELILDWPAKALAEMKLDAASYVVVLTHDEKLDEPALMAALNSPARYVGALGARKTHAKRVARLKAQGISDEQLRRIHAPIGLDIGAEGAEEIALAIMAEIVAVKRGIPSDRPTKRPHHS
jgi:xanthine dehydrogenase accessory factor